MSTHFRTNFSTGAIFAVATLLLIIFPQLLQQQCGAFAAPIFGQPTSGPSRTPHPNHRIQVAAADVEFESGQDLARRTHNSWQQPHAQQSQPNSYYHPRPQASISQLGVQSQLSQQLGQVPSAALYGLPDSQTAAPAAAASQFPAGASAPAPGSELGMLQESNNNFVLSLYDMALSLSYLDALNMGGIYNNQPWDWDLGSGGDAGLGWGGADGGVAGGGGGGMAHVPTQQGWYSDVLQQQQQQYQQPQGAVVGVAAPQLQPGGIQTLYSMGATLASAQAHSPVADPDAENRQPQEDLIDGLFQANIDECTAAQEKQRARKAEQDRLLRASIESYNAEQKEREGKQPKVPHHAQPKGRPRGRPRRGEEKLWSTHEPAKIKKHQRGEGNIGSTIDWDMIQAQRRMDAPDAERRHQEKLFRQERERIWKGKLMSTAAKSGQDGTRESAPPVAAGETGSAPGMPNISAGSPSALQGGPPRRGWRLKPQG